MNDTYISFQKCLDDFWFIGVYPICYSLLVFSKTVLMNLTKDEYDNFEFGVFIRGIKLVRGSGKQLHATIIVWKYLLMALGAVFLDDQLDKISLPNYSVALIWCLVELFIGDIFPQLISLAAKKCDVKKFILARIYLLFSDLFM
jgi:hypothetical protein